MAFEDSDWYEGESLTPLPHHHHPSNLNWKIHVEIIDRLTKELVFTLFPLPSRTFPFHTEFKLK
jgi:hypothetical protein